MPKFLSPKICFALFILTIALAACSGASNNQSQDAQPTVLPTLTTIPMFNFVQPTFPPQIQTLAASTAAASSSTNSTTSPASGQQIYTTLACNSCHGDKGEGTAKGSALTTYTKSEDDFISFLRSGGTVGSTHIYAVDRLSDSDAKTLYEYVQSLVTK